MHSFTTHCQIDRFQILVIIGLLLNGPYVDCMNGFASVVPVDSNTALVDGCDHDFCLRLLAFGHPQSHLPLGDTLLQFPQPLSPNSPISRRNRKVRSAASQWQMM
jgi:hypothetical protein